MFEYSIGLIFTMPFPLFFYPASKKGEIEIVRVVQK